MHCFHGVCLFVFRFNNDYQSIPIKPMKRLRLGDWGHKTWGRKGQVMPHAALRALLPSCDLPSLRPLCLVTVICSAQWVLHNPFPWPVPPIFYEEVWSQVLHDYVSSTVSLTFGCPSVYPSVFPSYCPICQTELLKEKSARGHPSRASRYVTVYWGWMGRVCTLQRTLNCWLVARGPNPGHRPDSWERGCFIRSKFIPKGLSQPWPMYSATLGLLPHPKTYLHISALPKSNSRAKWSLPSGLN